MKNACLALGIVASCALSAAVAFAEEVREFHKELSLDPLGRVSIETYKGSITVSTWEKPRVEIHARVVPDETGQDQAEKVRKTEVRIEGSGSSVRIESDYDRAKKWGFAFWGNDGTLPFVHYTIRMPRSAKLEIEDYKSRIRIAALDGDLKLNTYKGRVDLEGVRGVELESYKGEVRAAFSSFDRESEFETYKGDISVEMPPNARFDLDAEIGRRGDLNLGFDLATREGHRLGRDRYRGSVNGGGPRLRLQTYKGSLSVRKR